MKVGITINFDISFFSNGLQQNIVFLQNLINNIENFSSFFIFKGDNIDQEFIDKNFCVHVSELFKENNLDFDLIILMGFSLNNKQFRELKNKNKKTKFILMQCGNQYIENMTYSLFKKPDISPVEPLEELDEIWILPHYEKNISYMKTYYKNDNVKIVPYLWESIFVDYQIKYVKNIFNEKAPYLINNKDIIVMEPNLNSSKNCILPLYIVEAFEKQYPKVVESCNLLAAEKFLENNYFIDLVSQLNIYRNREKFLQVLKRKTLINAINDYGSLVISHQQDNALNNLYFEVLYLGLPLLHNSKLISEYGYFYPENDIDEAVKQLNYIITNHKENFPRYKKNIDKLLDLYTTQNQKNKKLYYQLILRIK